MGIVGLLVPDMFDSRVPVGPKPVEAETVSALIDLLHEPRSQDGPLRWIYLTLEHRILNPLAEVLTKTGHATQPAAPSRIAGSDIVGHKHQHKRFPYRQRKGG